MNDPRPTRRQRRIRRIIAIAVPMLLLFGGFALAWTIGTTNPGNSVTAATIGAASGVTPSTTNSCTTIRIDWTAASQANDYLIEITTDNGSYSTVIASTGNVVTYTDATNRNASNRTYTYRVTPKLAGSSWTGTPATGQIICGIGEVNDLIATKADTCTATGITLTWSAAGGTATNYEIFRSINGAAATLAAGNITALTWADTRVLGQSVTYYLIPQNAANANGNQSNTTPAIDVGFFIKSAAFANAGTANSLGNGDSVTVTFSRASNGVLPGGANANRIYVMRNGARGVYLAAANTTVAQMGIALLPFGANITGTSGAHAGTAVWGSGNTVWTWTRGAAAAVAYTAPTWPTTNVTLGTAASRVKCSDGTTNLAASNPADSGWF